MTYNALKAPSSEPAGGNCDRLNLNERLRLLSLIDEGLWGGATDSPIVGELFENLWSLVDSTVSGSKINRLNPEDTLKGFHVFEVNADTGESLGRLNMIYLNKPIPCYYLVYVEVTPLFRRRGLGNSILKRLKSFLDEKSAVGILDNVIPADDPSYSIYFKQSWQPVERVTGGEPGGAGNYMIYVPPALLGRDLREPVLKLLSHLDRKRPAIDMRDNEEMVRRTVSEFKDLNSALMTYFEAEIIEDQPSPFMRFLFTRFAQQLIEFRKSIGELIGYTGGESIEQVTISAKVAALPAQFSAPADLACDEFAIWGGRDLSMRVMQLLKDKPASTIESLPNWTRPCVVAWIGHRQEGGDRPVTIGDLMEIGFDPTRYKQIEVDGRHYVFERIQLRKMGRFEENRARLSKLASITRGMRAHSAPIKVNRPLLVIKDRGNAYVLRERIEAIHWEEAVEQIKRDPRLKRLGESMNLESLILSSVRKASRLVDERLRSESEHNHDASSWFVSWDLEANQPKLFIGFEGQSLEAIWLV